MVQEEKAYIQQEYKTTIKRLIYRPIVQYKYLPCRRGHNRLNSIFIHKSEEFMIDECFRHCQ